MYQVLERLRACMRNEGIVGEALAAYLVPTDDAHQSEYIAECDKRRAYITGFTGSAGIAVVTNDRALLWTDGRYHLQASQQIDPTMWTLMKQGNSGVPSVAEWLSKELPSDARIGFDPYLISEALYKSYDEALEYTGQQLVAIATNLVDEVWSDRPPRSAGPLMVLPLRYTGRSVWEKVGDVRVKMAKKGANVLIITALDEIAWLFNLRGSDVPYNPVFFAYSLVTTTSVCLFLDVDRLTPDVYQHLNGEGMMVDILPYNSLSTHLSIMLHTNPKWKIWISDKSSCAMASLVPKHNRVTGLSPIQMLKAVKNETELQGMRNAQLRDSCAVCEYLAWLEGEVPKGYLTEITAADKLEALRREQEDFVSLSFPTISSSGPNGAIIHYFPTPDTDRKLSLDELYLCDSGGQYKDGTTDVTRTVHFGTPTDKQKEAFTYVLKGHIALCSVVFPSKLQGVRIEALARAPLWSVGLDYKHGTGHGVGAFLNVHEGPQGINQRWADEGLYAGMVVTDEPGFYEDGEFGIRIENVVIVKNADTKYNFGGGGYLTFEPITLVPIQNKMMIPQLLTPDEIEWLNRYNATCFDKVGDLLLQQGKMDVLLWLERETEPIEPIG